MANHTLTFMAVHAHPDDELIGTGGVLARYSHEGINTVLVTCTRGEVGEIHDPDLDEEEARPRLGDIRIAELQCALDIIGVPHSEQLGYRDSGMIGTADNEDPRSFNKADLGEATGRLVRLVREYRPDVLVCYNETGGYGHPDHVNAHRITVAAYEAAADPAQYPDMGAPHQVQKLYYTSWNFKRWQALTEEMKARGLKPPFGDDDEDSDKTPEQREKEAAEWMERVKTEMARQTTEVDCREYVTLVRRAARCHRTQFSQDSFFYTLPDDLNELAFGKETFVRVKLLVDVAEGLETDLFAGLR